MAHHFNVEGDNIKSEPSTSEHSLWPPTRNRTGPLPPISEWYNDGNDTRRSSTSSLASSTALISEAQSPVDPIGDNHLNERATRRLYQLSGHMLPSLYQPSEHDSSQQQRWNPSSSSSSYPSPGSTPGPEDHVVQRSKAKAKARSARGVTQAPDATSIKDLTPELIGQKKVKADRETVARFEQSQALARAWEECLIHNPDMLHEGVTRDGKKGLKKLKRNNIDDRIVKAGLLPNQINKDLLIDLITIMLRNHRATAIREIDNHRKHGRYDDALRLERELRAVGTHL
ncbi:uncharacterized protein N0V89_002487 [Didymosphaeria variabile]|uniref:Uncharacterized protein n=1 Tax=Didymosphaeria variabile TaxID=1932322 RepID=A0A9W8XRQ9_9PLEO|nr:uncharacterized protein N0V89_002487 [Didymosphaeria variabile]KAJ4357910.1 hypothetical protein N0V89_002487 [Didymosphaeria variabile]